MKENKSDTIHSNLVALAETLGNKLDDLKACVELIQQEVDLTKVKPLFDKFFTLYDQSSTVQKILRNNLPIIEIKQQNLKEFLKRFQQNFSSSLRNNFFLEEESNEKECFFDEISLKEALISLQNLITSESDSKINILLREIDQKKEKYFEIILTDNLNLFNVDYNNYILERGVFYNFFLNKPNFLKAYGIILQHKGKLFINKNDQGNAFSVLLPKVSSFSNEKKDELNLYGNETILVVDDEDNIWNLFIQELKFYGYNVILAENGEECVEIYQNNHNVIDLITLDIIMPKMNGHLAFEKIIQINNDAKVIISSGYAGENIENFLQKGCTAFLQKPYPMIRLIEEIRKALDN